MRKEVKTYIKHWDQKFEIIGTIVLFLLPLIGISPKTYLTLTISGLAFGMLLFLLAAGLSVIFGLMDVINFAHGACFAWGAYVGLSIFRLLIKLVEANSLFKNLAVFCIGIIIVMVAVGILGSILERIFIRRVYGQHLFQILITFGVGIVLAELIRIFWGTSDQFMPVPIKFQGNWDIREIVVIRYPVIAIIIGLIVYSGIQLIINRTKVGIIIRAGVENRQMVQALGHNIHRLFTGVFAAGAGLAGLGGFAMAVFSQQLHPDMGTHYIIFAFIVVIIGGLGSIRGSLVGALIVGVSYNYVAYLFPPLAVGASIFIMVIIILIRPTGLFQVGT